MAAWECPKCGAGWAECGEGECQSPKGFVCSGLCCECPRAGVPGGSTHGELEDFPCENAQCYHCGWKGCLPFSDVVVRDNCRNCGGPRLASDRGVFTHANPADCFLHTQARLREVERERDKARATINAISEWTHVFGAALCPRGADTYGEGVRACKTEVAALIHRSMEGR